MRAGRDLTGRVAVVSGASSGIGRELSRMLASQGAHVALVARRAERLAELEAQICDAGGVARALPCDLCDPAAVAALPDRVQAGLGDAEILVNNAGRGAHGAFDAIDLAVHRQVVETNLNAVIACTYAFLPQLLKRKGAQLVFVSSVLGRLPAPDHAVYGATKWAVSGLAESLSYELRGRGIDVVLVEPGLVRSEFAARADTPLVRYRWVPSRSSADAAAATLQAMVRSDPHHIADGTIAAIIALKRHLPRGFRRIFRAAYGRVSRG